MFSRYKYMRAPGYYISALVVVAIAAMALVSCSPRKNTAATRRYQAFITKYNIYYNGDKHYVETLDEMENKYEDDYSQLVFMHPVEAKNKPDAPQPSGNFDRSIEKGQKAIQLRSIRKRPARKGKSTPAQKEWLKREEYNPFLHNAWMMMGRGQYMNGDFLGAASTFFYISRHFSWLPATVTEAELWQARSYVSLDWLFEAELILERIKPEQLVNKTLRGLYAFVKADWLIHSDRLADAVPFLKDAISAASGPQKTRLRFLLGQIYSRIGDKEAAYKAFEAAGSSSAASYRTKFNARIKQSEVYTGSDVEPEVKALRRMVRYDRNKDYLDQIYYAIGNLYLSRRDTVKAIENYKLAAEKSTRNGIDKAISQITLGTLYFERHEYEKSQPCFAEAVPLLPKDYPDYKTLKRRSDVLDELAVYAQNVALQDSLLRLSEMTPEQRLEVVNKIIDELKKKEKEEAEAARKEEYLANQATQGSNLQDNTNSFTINSDNSWYFYNTATRNAGKTEFQRRWGSRKLEDNWRRRNKSQFNADDWAASASPDDADTGDDMEESEAADSVASPDEEELQRSADPHFPEYYLAQIPETPEQKATANEIIQEGLYNMGVILKDKLEDFSAARSEFDRLLKDYPDNVYRLDVYYNLYLMYARENDLARAAHYRNLILSDFPDSPYGQAMRDPAYLDNLRLMDARQQQMYDRAYDAYLSNRNKEVHAVYEDMKEQFPLSKIMPKFMFLHALAYVTERKPEEFNATLRELLERYPDTDITPVASAWLKGMAQGRELQASQDGNMRGMIWDMRLAADSVAEAAGEGAFELAPDDKQLLVLTFATDEVSTNELLYELARHNFKSFVVKDFDLEPLNFGRLGMIVIRSFDSMPELEHYRKVMSASPDFKMPPGVRPVVISDRNFKLLIDEGRSFDEYFRFLQQANAEQAESWAGPAPEPPADAVQPVEPAAPDDSETPQPEPEEAHDADAVEPAVPDMPAVSVEADTVPDAEEPVMPQLPETAEPEMPVDTVPAPVAPVLPEVEEPVAPAPEQPAVPAPETPQPEPAQPVAPQPAVPAQPQPKPAAPQPVPEAPVIVPVPVPSNMPSYDPGSEGDDPLFD